MKKFFVAGALLIASTVCQAQDSSGCQVFTKGQVEVKNFGRTSRVYGEMAPFNHCNKSVSLELPSRGPNKLGEKPPVVVLLHGGGGLEGYQKSAAGIWRSEGFATLVFDAFEMNGLDSSTDLVKYKLASDLFSDYQETKRDVGGRTFYATRGAPVGTREKTWATLKEFFKSKL